MFKTGQIWDRSYSTGLSHVALIVGCNEHACKVFIISGHRAGFYQYWYVRLMMDAIRMERMVQLG